MNEHWIVENELILDDSFWVRMMFGDSFSIRVYSNVLWNIPFSAHIIFIFKWFCRTTYCQYTAKNSLSSTIHDYIASFTIKSANNNRNCRMNNHHRQYSVVCYTNFHWYIIENNSFMPWKWMKIAIQLCKFIREKKPVVYVQKNEFNH